MSIKSFCIKSLLLTVVTSCVASPCFATTIASGEIDGNYYKVAAKLCENKPDCHVTSTTGSAQNLEMLKSGTVDFAIVQDNLAKSKNLLGYEYLYVIYRNNLKVKKLEDLSNYKTASIIGEGSNSLIKPYTTLNIVYNTNSTKEAIDLLCSHKIDYKAFVISSPNVKIENFLSQCDLKVLSIINFNYPLETVAIKSVYYSLPKIPYYLVSKKDI